jgi:hypothetical protein
MRGNLRIVLSDLHRFVNKKANIDIFMWVLHEGRFKIKFAHEGKLRAEENKRLRRHSIYNPQPVVPMGTLTPLTSISDSLINI